MNAIEVKDLIAGYENHMVIDGMSLKIPKGKITVIIGSNGCGKSTLLKTIGRLIKPKGGDVFIEGSKIASMKTLDIAKQMAVLPQTPVAPSGLTVSELVAYGRYPHSPRQLSQMDYDIIHWSLEVTKLKDLENQEVDRLSGGQRQRAWIAMAIAQKTEIILLDEPTTYLDMAYQLEVLELLNELNKSEGYTIVMVLHDLNMAARYADHMIALKDGNIVASGSPVEMMTPEILRDTFHIHAHIGEDHITGKPVCISYHLA